MVSFSTNISMLSLTLFFSHLIPFPYNIQKYISPLSGDLALVRDVFFVLGDIVDGITRELQKVTKLHITTYYNSSLN